MDNSVEAVDGVSCTLFISSIVLMTWVGNIMSYCYSYLGPKENPYILWSILKFLALCSGWTCDWVSRVFMLNHKLLCLDSIILLYSLDLIRSSLTTWYNLFLSEDLIELSLIPYSWFLWIIYTPVFFLSHPLGRWWNSLSIIFSIILLVKPRPHGKYSRILYPNMHRSFNYSDPYGTNDHS